MKDGKMTERLENQQVFEISVTNIFIRSLVFVRL